MAVKRLFTSSSRNGEPSFHRARILSTMKSTAFDRVYPASLHEKEAELLNQRRQNASLSPAGVDVSEAGGSDDSRIGVALSGGGIRSATFCLGVFQALAQQRLLRRIDFLSTVSGGSYFGGFFGRLFTRTWIKDAPSSQGFDASPPGDEALLKAEPDAVGRVQTVLSNAST